MKTLQVRNAIDSQTYNVDVEPRQSIRVYGEYTNRIRYIPEIHADGSKTYRQENYSQPFDLTFKIGDYAEYDSYNLSYCGKIVSIGEKTVTIKHYEQSSETSRLSFADFSWRNWDYDADKIAERNAAEMMCI